MLQEGQRLTSRLCQTAFAVTRDTTTRDFELLMKLGIVRRQGKGRSTSYILVTFAKSSDKHFQVGEILVISSTSAVRTESSDNRQA